MKILKLGAVLIITMSVGWMVPPQPRVQAQAVEFASLGSGIGAAITKVTLDSNDLIYDPSRSSIYASIPGSSGNGGNSIIPIGVPGGKTGSAIFVGSEPNKLAISDDGQYLYVGLDGAAAVRRVNLTTQTAELQFALGSGSCGVNLAEDIVVLKNRPGSIAVSKKNSICVPRHEGVTIFDDGVARPNSTPNHTGSNVIEPAETESKIYGYNNETTEYGFRVMSIDANGISVDSSTSGLINDFNIDIRSNQNFVYATNGVVINPDTLSVVGAYPVNGFTSSVIPDRVNGRVYFLGTDDTTEKVRLVIYDEATFTAIADILLSTVTGYPKSFIQTGKDSFAFRTTPNSYQISADQVYLMRLVDMKHTYLPLTVRAGEDVVPSGIYGYVTDASAPAPGVPVELRRFDGANWYTQSSTKTDAAGRYVFSHAPSLLPGQMYYVRYLNETNSTRLGYWNTRLLEDYTTGVGINIGNFDIANVNLVQPSPGAKIVLPYSFRWFPRPATPTDQYEFNLYDFTDGDPFFYTDPPLGYTNQYTLFDLPPGFNHRVAYGWYIGVLSPDGGYGYSFWAYEVTFSQLESPELEIEELDGSIQLWQVKNRSFSGIEGIRGR